MEGRFAYEAAPDDACMRIDSQRNAAAAQLNSQTV
jgi:hypothetical protein